MKAKNLQLLKEAGIPVPAFDIVKWENRKKRIEVSKYNGKYAVRSY